MKEGWEIKKLGDICELYQPKTISSKEMVADGDYTVFGANGIIGKYDKYNHDEPQLLITCRGATCGSINISEPKSWINGNAMVVRPKDSSLNLKFLEYLFLGGIDISRTITGAAQPQITRQSLSPVLISYPKPLPEQQRIVAILDKAFAAIDKAKANAEKNLKNAKELFESYLQGVFENNSNRAGHFINFDEACNLVGGSQPSKDDFIYESKEGYTRLIQVRDYRTDKYKTFIPTQKAKRFCTKDDIMIGRYGPPIFGIFHGLEGAYNVALMKAVVNENLCNKNYFFWYLNTKKLRQFVEHSSKRAAGQDGVRKELLDKYPVWICSLKEQKVIAQNLDALSAETKRLE
jgi:type I restriction enzyme S subunit